MAIIIIKKKIETGIPQDFLVSLVLFLIYISRVFNKVLKTSFLVTSLFFIDNLGFIGFDSLVKEIVRVLEKVVSKIIDWGRLNAVIFNRLKTEAVIFSKSQLQRLNKRL